MAMAMDFGNRADRSNRFEIESGSYNRVRSSIGSVGTGKLNHSLWLTDQA